MPSTTTPTPKPHAFNTPCQLSISPSRITAWSRALRDFPRDANVTSHVVRHGDLLIFATDGVCDYLSPGQNLNIVSEVMTNFYAWQTEEKGTSVGRRLEDLIKEEYPPTRKNFRSKYDWPRSLLVRQGRRVKIHGGMDRSRKRYRSPIPMRITMAARLVTSCHRTCPCRNKFRRRLSQKNLSPVDVS